jgi:cytochrome c biogenesis protein ResB
MNGMQMNMVKVISKLKEIMGMVLMKVNKSNTMTNYGDSVRTTIVNDGNSIRKTTINGNFVRITTNNGKFVETTIDNTTSIKITKQGEEVDLIAN